MAIETKWLVEGHVFHVMFPAVLDSAVMRDYDDFMTEQLDKAPNKIHFIADLSGLKTMPGLSVLVGLRHPYHPQLGHGLTVGLTRNPVGRFLIAMGTQLAGVHHKDFDSFDEARAYLTQMEGI